MAETASQNPNTYSEMERGTVFDNGNVLDLHKSSLSPVEVARTAVASSFESRTFPEQREHAAFVQAITQVSVYMSGVRPQVVAEYNNAA